MEAIADFNKAFELGCEDAQVYNARAMAYKYMEKYAEAIVDLDTAIKEDEQNVEYLFNRSQCFFDMQQYDNAANDLTKAIRLESKEAKYVALLYYHFRLYYLRGLSNYEMKKYKDSIKDLKKALKLKQASAFAHDCYYHIGIAYCNLQKHESAVPAFTRAIENNKDNEIAMYYHERAKTFQHLEHFEEALVDFSKVIMLQPTNAHAYFRRAFTYKALNRFEEAAEDFEKARTLQPDNPNLVVNYKKIHDIAYIELCAPGEEYM